MTDNELQDPPKTGTTESLETTSKPGEDTSTNAMEETDSDSTLAPAMPSDEGNDGDKDSDQDNGQDDGNAETETSEDNSNNNNNNNNNDDAEEDTRTEEEIKRKEEEEIKKIEEKVKTDYKDWPQENIKEPHPHDVLYGRGGGTNHHPGNKRYRKMVEDKKVEYVNSRRLDKPLVAYGILRKWRAQLPPGRFLKVHDKTGLWYDVGDKAAREKTSQALREKAPQIRKQQEEEQHGASSLSETGSDEDRKPAAKGKKKGKPKKAILQREHTLGETYLSSGEDVDISGFTWITDDSNRNLSTGSRNSAQGTVLPPPTGRSSSRGSAGMPFSSGFNTYPTPPDYHGRVYSGEQRRELSNSSIGTFYSVPGSAPFTSGGQLPPQPPNAAPMHHRSDSWTLEEQAPSPRHGPHHQRTGSWNGNGDMRSHSLSGYPLPGATVHEAAPYWSQSNHPPGAYARFSNEGSMGSMGQPSQPPPPPPPPPPPYRQIPSPSHSNTSSPPSNAMDYERSWNAGGGSTPPLPPPQRDFAYQQYDAYPPTAVGADSSPPRGPEYRPIPRPGMIKRDTSNQNETYESKPNKVKRAALNRDQSATSNRLKQEHMSEVFHQDMQSLQQTTEQIQLSSPEHERRLVDAFDANSAGAGTNPMPLPLGNRRTSSESLSSIDALLNNLAPVRPQPPLQPLPRPAPWNESNRMTTAEFLNAPLGDDDDLRDDNDLPTK